MATQATPARSVQQAGQGSVLFKLVVFSVSLALVPISSYFLSEKYVWNGNSTYAALSAVFAAHFVLVAYIVVSVWEDTTSTSAKLEKEQAAAKGTTMSSAETKKDK